MATRFTHALLGVLLLATHGTFAGPGSSTHQLRQTTVVQQPSMPSSPSAGGYMSSGSSAGQSAPPPSSEITDADVLMFAYNLECLEGQYYSCAAFGTPLNTSITGNGPAPSSCTKANLSSLVGAYAAELAREETDHVADLYAALTAAGYSPMCPYVAIDSAFEAAAEAAFNQSFTALSPAFNPSASDFFVLSGAFLLEDLGCSAYLGRQGLITSASYRQVAGLIGNTEAYHASNLRTQLYDMLDSTPAYGKTVAQITEALVPLVAALNALSGPPHLKYNIVNSRRLANVGPKAYTPVATVAQVLNVVTLGAPNGQGGGFFPNNLAGNVKN